jgi:hypothetical protein
MDTLENAGTPFYQMISQPGLARATLTGITGGTTKIFWGDYGGNGSNSPPMTCDDTYHLESEQANGGTHDTVSGGSNTMPAWSSPSAGRYGGWQMRLASVTTTTAFIYT